MAKRSSSSGGAGDADTAAGAPLKRLRLATADVDGAEIEAELATMTPPPAVATATAAEEELVVVAPMFTPVHRSWDEFEQSLKEYAQTTYQLYVVRTTTSVKRRNQRITDNTSPSSAAAKAKMGASSAAAAAGELEPEAVGEGADGDGASSVRDDALGGGGHHQHQQLLIPESYRWYSKTLMCTHGWKDRHRGSGKRALAMARSTSCPAKMCVTLQHRGKSAEGWQVVLTRHVRTHNHQLSKELFLHYSENRRIYDPDLLLVPSGADALAGDAPQVRDAHHSRSGLSHLLVDVDAPHAALAYEHPSGLEEEHGTVDSELAAARLSEPNAPADGHGVFLAPRVGEKAHASWEHFHKYVAEYALASKQSFRARSTVSATAKNLKAAALAIKTGRGAEDIARMLLPTDERWYSKMLICSHGWKRKSRSKAPSARADGDASSDHSCPALLMARLQRDGNDRWHVVINRQVAEHNHPLGAAGSSEVISSSGGGSASTSTVLNLQRPAGGSEPNHSILHYFGADVGGDLSDNGDHEFEAEDEAPQHIAAPPHPQREVVVRAPKFETVHASWEAFHARLQEYSDATFQLYRTRTTSSVQGRNEKIPDLRRSASTEDESSSSGSRSETKTIPSEWKWYSKTLTCTHGWKERRRGTGKRTVQVFRSTACPVKLCATVQFVEAGDVESGDGGSSDNSSAKDSRGEWRVVVTKHVADHNHNLSKELQQHYSENRRIYDPDLLTIDETNDAVVVKQKKKHHSFLESHVLTHRESSGISGSAARIGDGNTGVEEDGAGAASSANAAQHLPVSALHTFALMSGDAPLALGLSAAGSAHTSGSASSGTTDSGVGSTTLAAAAGAGSSTSQLVSSAAAQMSSFAAGAFPSIPSSSTLFSPTSGSQLNSSAFMFQPHQFFAVDHPNAALGFAVPHFATTQSSMPTSSAPLIGGGGGASTEASFSGGSSLLGRCRIHSAGLQRAHLRGEPSAMSQCTCLRAVGIASAATPPSARARPPASLAADSASFQASIARLQAHIQATSSSNILKRVQRDGSDDADHDPGTGDAAGEDESASCSAVWVPAHKTEIVRLASSSGTTFWRAPRIQRLHASWELFHEHLDAYSLATFQLLRVRTTSSISARNARISQQSADRREVPTPVGDTDSSSLATPPLLVPDAFQWYSKTFVCTHGWKERRRGNGQRMSHSLRSTACPAKLCVTLQRVVHEADRWHVVVTRQGTDHNHELSAQAYQQYSEVRRVKDAALLERAEELWKKGLTRRKIFEFLKEHAAATSLLMKDVHNLAQRWQLQHGATRHGGRRVLEEDSDGASARGHQRLPAASDGANDVEEASDRVDHELRDRREEADTT